MPELPNELWWEILAHAISRKSILAMVQPSSERLHPLFPGILSGLSDADHFASWKRSNTVARNFMQVNRLWWVISERFLYSTLYVQEEWQMQKFIETIKSNPNLAGHLRSLVNTPFTLGMKGCLDPLLVQVLGLCPGVVVIMMGSYFSSSLLPLFQSLNSSRHLLLLSAMQLENEEFPIFMINFNNYTSLQILELSISTIDSNTLPSIPEHITFPSLHTLALALRDSRVLNVVGK